MKLSRYEQETIVYYNAGEQTATLYARDKAVMRKLDTLAADFPKTYKLTGPGEISKTYSFPKSYVSYRKPKAISTEQRERVRQMMIEKNKIKRDKNGYFPSLTIETVNMYEMLEYCKTQKYKTLSEYLLQGIYNLEKAGADFAILASNTPHVVFDILKQKAHIPLLSIIEPTCQAVKENELENVALLGTAFTMEKDWFKKVFVDNGINVAIPNEEER